MKQIFMTLALSMILTLVGCTAASTPPAELESVSLQLGWQHGSQFLGYYIAQTQGYYAEEGLNVVIEPLADANDIGTLPEKVAAQEIDFSMGTQLYVTEAQLRGATIIPIAFTVQLSPTVFFARADSDIVTPADFSGRRIVVKNNEWQQLLETLLANDGLTLDDIEPIAGGFDMTPFYNGEVEIWSGYLNSEVIFARQQGIDLVTFPLYEYGIEEVGEAVFTSLDLLETRPDLVQRFVRATLRGWEWAVENPTEAVNAMIELYPDLAGNREFHLASFNAYIPLARLPGIEIGTIDCERWLSNEAFAELDSTEGFCTTDIFEQASQEN